MTAATPLPAHSSTPPRDQALVWIDAREAVIVTRHLDTVVVDRLESDVPAHHKATGQVRHEPGIRHGGGGPTQTAGEPHRIEHLRHWVATVLGRLPATSDLTIIGPGSVREQLEREVRAADRIHHRDRTVTGAPAGRRTDRQLVAQLSRSAGIEPRRRTVGAYRWGEGPSTVASGRHESGPHRVTSKPAHPRVRGGGP